jgi:tetratricopeptide (TPR) repeat protein
MGAQVLKASALAVLAALLITSCSVSSEEIEFKKAQQTEQAGDHEGAITHFRAIMNRSQKSPLSIQSAKEAARISHYELKHFNEAIEIYRRLILYAPDQGDRVSAQKEIAEIYFNQLLDYNQAVTEYQRLLDLPHSVTDDMLYRMAIARSYFYLSNFFQALVEIDEILQTKLPKSAVVPVPATSPLPQKAPEKSPEKANDAYFEPLLLKANILLNSKRLDEAVVVLNQLIAQYPERSQTESVGMVLAVCYEEQKNFAKAIETLQAARQTDPRKDFIDRKIKLLKERQSYMPGAKGLKK